MSLSKERIFYLLNAYSENKATEREIQELFKWMNTDNEHQHVRAHIQKVVEESVSAEAPPSVDWELVYKNILLKSAVKKTRPVIRYTNWLRSSAAALVILFMGTGTYLYFRHSSPQEVVAHKTANELMRKDVAPPASSKAVLTLADGSRIQLDSIGNGTLARQGTVQVIKQADGQIAYKGTNNEILYNTLNVPRGSKVVAIKLSDGTQVWLNSESSLRYPASFAGVKREVEITGEAYFEVAHNAAMPFIVKKDAIKIKVLGTHFNINTYNDEGISKVTLLEGSVEISYGDRKNSIKPGQQAQIGDNIKLVNGVDIEEVMAWKNGKFQFGEKADLHVIMKKIARWYDVDVAYEGGPVNQQFGGEMPMNSNLSQVLEILRTSGVKFSIDGKKVTVTP